MTITPFEVMLNDALNVENFKDPKTTIKLPDCPVKTANLLSKFGDVIENLDINDYLVPLKTTIDSDIETTETDTTDTSDTEYTNVPVNKNTEHYTGNNRLLRPEQFDEYKPSNEELLLQHNHQGNGDLCLGSYNNNVRNNRTHNSTRNQVYPFNPTLNGCQRRRNISTQHSRIINNKFQEDFTEYKQQHNRTNLHNNQSKYTARNDSSVLLEYDTTKYHPKMGLNKPEEFYNQNTEYFNYDETAREYISRFYNNSQKLIPQLDLDILNKYTSYDNEYNDNLPTVATTIAACIVNGLNKNVEAIKQDRLNLAAMYTMPSEVTEMNQTHEDIEQLKEYYKLTKHNDQVFENNLEKYKEKYIADRLHEIDPELLPVVIPATINELNRSKENFNLFKAIWKVIKSVVNAIVDAFKKIINFLKNVLQSFWKLILPILEKGMNIIIKFIITPLSYVLDLVAQGINIAIGGLSKGFDFIVKSIFDIVLKAFSFIQEALVKVIKFAFNIVTKVLRSIFDKFGEIFPFFKGFFDNVNSIFTADFWINLFQSLATIAAICGIFYLTYYALDGINSIKPPAKLEGRQQSTKTAKNIIKRDQMQQLKDNPGLAFIAPNQDKQIFKSRKR